MKTSRIFFIAIGLAITLGAFAQRVNRGDVCQNIPNLSLEQKQEIDKLCIAHQKKMDQLREQFYAEPDINLASDIKRKMSTETSNHYKNIAAQLSPEQRTWFDQNCYAGTRSGLYYGRGYGAGYGRGYGRGAGRGYGRFGCARWNAGPGYGQGTGMGRGRYAGRGYARW